MQLYKDKSPFSATLLCNRFDVSIWS